MCWCAVKKLLNLDTLKHCYQTDSKMGLGVFDCKLHKWVCTVYCMFHWHVSLQNFHLPVYNRAKKIPLLEQKSTFTYRYRSQTGFSRCRINKCRPKMQTDHRHLMYWGYTASIECRIWHAVLSRASWTATDSMLKCCHTLSFQRGPITCYYLVSWPD